MEEVDYKKLYDTSVIELNKLKSELDAFRLPGATKLFFVLNKQQNDLADLLASIKIKEINLSDAQDKTMERLKIIWASIGSLSPIIETIRVTSGLTGNETKDMDSRVPFIETVAIKRD